MAAKSPSVHCAIAGCELPPGMGRLICKDHELKPMTLRQRIEKGAHWFLRKAKDAAPCAACGDPAVEGTDGDTGLCRPCWRAWRWSAIREYETTR